MKDVDIHTSSVCADCVGKMYNKGDNCARAIGNTICPKVVFVLPKYDETVVNGVMNTFSKITVRPFDENALIIFSTRCSNIPKEAASLANSLCCGFAMHDLDSIKNNFTVFVFGNCIPRVHRFEIADSINRYIYRSYYDNRWLARRATCVIHLKNPMIYHYDEDKYYDILSELSKYLCKLSV